MPTRWSSILPNIPSLARLAPSLWSGSGEASCPASLPLTFFVLSDLAHRMMTIEAMHLFGWPVTGISQRLRRHAAEIRGLTLFRRAIEGAHQSGLHLLPVSPQQVSAAAAISQQFGLLSGDALIVAVMREHGLVNLVSYDSDFDRVSGITRYAPT